MTGIEYFQPAGAAVVMLGAIGASLRFIFAPRIEKAVSRGLAPVVARAESHERRLNEHDGAIRRIEEGQGRAEKAIEGMATDINGGLDRLGGKIDSLTAAHEGTAKKVEFIRGAMAAGARTRKKAN